MQSVAEHVPHNQQVGVLALHSDSVHGQELREQRTAVARDNMLEENSGEWGMIRGEQRKREHSGARPCINEGAAVFG